MTDKKKAPTLHVRIGQGFTIGGIRFKVSYVHAGKNRLQLTPVGKIGAVLNDYVIIGESEDA